MINSPPEKVYLSFIFKNKKYFNIVEPYFFRNTQIQFLYKIIKKYIISKPDAVVPTPKQIWDMVSIEDKEGLITKEILKSMLQVNLDEYDEKNFLVPRFNSWILINRLN